MTTYVGIACLIIGALFMLIAAVGLVRLPDLFTRMHAITKAGTVGVGFMMFALIAFLPEASVVTQALGVMLFVALTAPVSAHMISRAAYLTGVNLWQGTFVDELHEEHADRSEAPAASGD